MYERKYFCESPKDGGALSGIGQAWNDITGTSASAAAAQSAATATLNQQRSDRQQALGYVAPSDQEIQQLQQSIQLNSQDISRKQQLLNSADPALIEAGKQAQQLLQGKDAAALAPLRNQRAQQRQQLQQSLAQQLGPDYATSSAGLQALNSFDQQTSDVMATQQSQSLAQFMGYATNNAQLGSLQNNIGNSQSLANQYGSIGTRQANALQGFQVNPSLQYAGDIANAKGFQGLANLGIGGAAAYFSGGALTADAQNGIQPTTKKTAGG